MLRNHPLASCWFVAGATTASLIWMVIYHKYHSFQGDIDDDDDESDDDSVASRRDAHISRKKSLIRWPWDTLRKSVVQASASFLNVEDIDSEDECNTSKTGPCIGAIFGLDVGGTLTKLVYFEEQLHEFKRDRDKNEGLHRQDHYHAAASALEVLQARRAANTTVKRHNTDSDVDLQSLWDMRIESVPDRLDEFASSCNITQSDAPMAERDAGEHDDNEFNNDHTNLPAESPRSTMKKSISMVNLSKTNEHAEALDNFYSFARRLDTYETAVKEKQLSYYSRFLNGQFHFIRFETRHMKNAMNLMRINNFHKNIKEIGATGGGAHKYANEWERDLGIGMAKQDEMDSLVAGMQFVMSDIAGECYTFKPNDWTADTKQPNEGQSSVVNGSLLRTPSRSSPKEKVTFSDPETSTIPPSPLSLGSSSGSESDMYGQFVKRQKEQQEEPNNKTSEKKPRVDQWWTSKKVQRDNGRGSNAFPYLLVSIGTGVSILRVDGPRQHERVSGSTIGGGTYWGLCRLLTGSDSFSDVLNLAMKGDPSKVDMMVGDIYGKDSNALEKIGLPSDVVASSFGKLVAKQNPSEGIKEEDLARALLLMVTNNIGQVAHLNAQLHETSRIYFVGTFLQHNTISQQRLAHAIDYWSNGNMEALFLEHEGYFGALGSFLLHHGIEHPTRKDVDAKQRKKRNSRHRLHQRSKSMGSIP